MLSSESIHQQMRDTSTCSTRQLNELKELMDLYPYASSITTLYLKSLANDRDLRLSSQLEKYAYQIPNRALLYELLVTQSSVSTKEVIQEVDESPQELTKEALPELEVQSIAPVIPLTEEISLRTEEMPLETEEEVEELETLIEPLAKSAHVPDEVFQEVREVANEEEEESALNIPHPHEVDEEMDEVDAMIQSAVISSSYLQIAYPGAAEEVDEEQEHVKSTNTPVTEETGRSVLENKQNSTDAEPKSFTDWLKIGNVQGERIEEPMKEEPKPTFYQFEKPKKEFFSPAKKAKESVDENKMPVSETLAQVFALQGNINKAIHVYEQLILIFPEKKSFFASQIRNLKRKLNS